MTTNSTSRGTDKVCTKSVSLRKKTVASGIAVAAAGGALAFGFSAPADGAPGLLDGAKIKPNTVTSKQIKNGQVAEVDLAAPVKAKLAKVGKQGKEGKEGKEGPAGTNGTNGTNGKDAFVDARTVQLGPTVIQKIGGTWSTNHTTAGTFTLQPGTYLVSVTGDFYALAARTATPVLQLAFYATDGSPVALAAYTAPFPQGGKYGATDGAPNGLEQTASAYDIVTVTKPTQIEVALHGYNADRGDGVGGTADGSGQFAANTKVTWVKVNVAH